MTSPEPPLAEWADRLEAAAAAATHLGIREVRVLSETGSTQVAAREASAGGPGWLVVAGRQTRGKGRLGREWADTEGLGLAMSLTLDARTLQPDWSVRSGLAVVHAADRLVGPGACGLRWPNDVVEASTGRKLAGVLVEVGGGCAVVGIGVNVRQPREHWPADLRSAATSLREFGAGATCVETAEAVIAELDRVAARSPLDVAQMAMSRDTVVGTRRTFQHDGRTFTGRVLSIDQSGSIVLRRDDGADVTLPAATTSMVHD